MYFLTCTMLNELKINMTRLTHVYWLAKLTIHFGVGLPLVVPASEGLAVVLGALLGPEVHGVNGARPSVTQLVETAGAGAKFTVVLRSTCTTWREKHRWRENFIKFMILLPGVSFFAQDLELPTVIRDHILSIWRQEVIGTNTVGEDALCAILIIVLSSLRQSVCSLLPVCQ